MTEITDFESYLQKRRETIRGYLQANSLSYDFDNESTAVLRDLSKKGNPLFVIMVVDIVGSTDMNIAMHPSAYGIMVQSFISEIRMLVRKQTGYVLKHTGDGLIAYFSEPNITGKHDNAIQCATRIPALVNEALNPVLNEFGMPSLQFRVGLDTGSAEIYPGAQNSQDLLGTTVSLAAKIESTAETNEILMGENTERNLHTDWRKQTADVTDARGWGYEIDGDLYRIFKI
jgi:class 3 adenylate cyclase